MSFKHIAALVPLVGLIVFGLFLWDRKVQPRIDKLEARIVQGRAAGSVLSGGLLVLVDHLTFVRRLGREADGSPREQEYQRTRLTTVDAASGAKLLTELFEGSGTCEAASPGRLWCDTGELALYDARCDTCAGAVSALAGCPSPFLSSSSTPAGTTRSPRLTARIAASNSSGSTALLT